MHCRSLGPGAPGPAVQWSYYLRPAVCAWRTNRKFMGPMAPDLTVAKSSRLSPMRSRKKRPTVARSSMSPKVTEEAQNEEEMKQIANSTRSTPPPKGDRLPFVLHLRRPDVHLAVEAKWKRMLIRLYP